MKNKILNWFKENYSELILEMKNSDHAYNKETPNPYHLEGNVWVHTQMVLTEASKLSNKEEVLLAALLHDIGKPLAREVIEETKRVRFFSHENISTMLAIGILLKYKKEVNENINMIRVLELINWHSDFHTIENGKLTKKQKIMLSKKYEEEELFKDMCNLSLADNLGRKSLNFKNMDTYKRLEFIKKTYYELKDEKNQENKVSQVFKNNLTLLIGVPNSGKSTYIENNNIENVLSFDNMITEKYPMLTYNEAYKTVMDSKNQGEDDWKEFEKRYNKELKEAIKNKRDITIDKTNLTKKVRNRTISQAKKETKKIAVMFLISIETLKKRNIKRNKEINKYINEKTFSMFMKRFTMPDKSEFDEIIYIIE
jgi:putative nucleotidyltransferase with HDIG domain